jgi:arsenate reductase-like glutaredoxin family protein
MTIVRVKHIRQAGYCASGARAWFQRHGIDYPDFLKNGIDAERILAIGDHLGSVVVECAKREEQQLKEAANGQGQ